MIELYIILLLTHLLSDFFFQPPSWAVKKKKNIKYRIYHCLQYIILFIPVLYFLKINFIWLIWLFFTHLFIDSINFQNFWAEKDSPEYLGLIRDQILHLLALLPLVIVKI